MQPLENYTFRLNEQTTTYILFTEKINSAHEKEFLLNSQKKDISGLFYFLFFFCLIS